MGFKLNQQYPNCAAKNEFNLAPPSKMKKFVYLSQSTKFYLAIISKTNRPY